ncbi:class I SAM-dependent methyltransferase [Usitatibacter palustris]|uniref:Methyltransferase domain-containing protein n=1 Tax=Usitatibacter palustris TaxID=2732487 RepID=A0A6M4H9M5_9PROT|nr:class I SAM-dependent methyltransferase [Usitatibacter palustris]QJR14747.1 hypothetical protein DSM104440_01557 [Usitatibacter palustris]
MKSLGLTLLLALPVAAQGTDEVPFITTPDHVTMTMLRMAKVTEKDYVLDLGSGDGRIVITAAKRFGARGLGVEIVPDLVKQSIENARKAKVSKRAEFREQDLFKTDLTTATVITMYLLPEVNLQLRPAILALKPGTRIVSHDWDMGDWKPDRTVIVDVPDKKVGKEKSSKVHLWTVPAKMDGHWCGSGQSKGVTLDVAQSYQVARATFTRNGKPIAVIGGTIDGAELKAMTIEGRKDAVWLRANGDKLTITRAQGELALAHGGVFTACK